MNTSPSPFSNSRRSTGGNVANAHDAFGCVHSGPYCAYRHSGNVGRCVSRIDTASGIDGGGGGDGEGDGESCCCWRAETVGSSGKTAGWEKLQIIRIWRDTEPVKDGGGD